SASDSRSRRRLVPRDRNRADSRRRMSADGQGAGSASGAPDGVFLIHGLGGTQYDLGSMHKRLKNAGLVTHSLTLPGHGTKPEDLVGVTAEDWIDAVVAKYREIRGAHPTLHLMGMCMGALLAATLAEREAHANGRLVLLAPPVFIDGWATPWYRGLRPLLYALPSVRNAMKVEEEEPYGIKNEQLRAIVKAKFERGENFHYRWVPLECLRQVDRLRAIVMRSAAKIRCPTLVVHAREDELTSLRSANFLVEKIGGGRARMVVLEDSYHMVCVDNDREIVAKNVLEFFGAPMPGAKAHGSNRKVRFCAHGTQGSCSKCAGSPTTSSAKISSSDRPILQRPVRRRSNRHSSPPPLRREPSRRRTTIRCSRFMRSTSKPASAM